MGGTTDQLTTPTEPVSSAALFGTSQPVLFFDYFRIPYRRSPHPPDWLPAPSLSWIDPGRGRPGICWPGGGAGRPGLYRLGAITIAAAVTTDADSPLRGDAAHWDAVAAITDMGGRVVAAVRRRPDGAVYLPFDPADTMRNLWSERYLDFGRRRSRRARGLAARCYYLLRPLIPRQAQLFMRRRYSAVQARATFPQWPAEAALHDVYDWLGRLVAEVAGTPVPSIAPWPRGRRWALVLTHDVETAAGRDRLGDLRAVEQRHGLRSAWYFVPRRYSTPAQLVGELTDAGCEVGVHGLYHDGRDLAPNTFPQREPEMQEARRRWGAAGFRSPALIRNAEAIDRLGFDYDTSYPDTDPYQPQAGGCCTWLPYSIGDVVEIPVTLAQDHTLFEILGERDERRWVEKAEMLRDRAGAAVLITHPDYMDPERLEIYGRFLARYRDDNAAWHALPSEIGVWWRRRAESWIEGSDGDWRIAGPVAGEGVVQLIG